MSHYGCYFIRMFCIPVICLLVFFLVIGQIFGGMGSPLVIVKDFFTHIITEPQMTVYVIGSAVFALIMTLRKLIRSGMTPEQLKEEREMRQAMGEWAKQKRQQLSDSYDRSSPEEQRRYRSREDYIDRNWRNW